MQTTRSDAWHWRHGVGNMSQQKHEGSEGDTVEEERLSRRWDDTLVYRRKSDIVLTFNESIQ